MTRHASTRRWLSAAILVSFLHLTNSLQLDNGVAGTPTIRCAENSITFSVRSQNIFRGNIYVKSQYGVPQCRQTYTTNDFSGASFTVRIGDCGMRRIRQIQPVGMNYMVVFIVNFHPQFVTKVDRAYNVRCFYAQSDKTVTSALEVSMIPTVPLEQATMLMPNCEYSVRSGSLNGPRVRYARVGDRLIHRWECDNPNFGMLVKNCFVNDGSGSNIRVLDSRGCPVFTPVIQGPLQYDNSLNLAYVEIWAYKFPDRSQLFFQCQIQVCNKRDNECVGVTPPNCPRVTQSNFTPGSVTDPNTNPTNVIGTFPNPNQPSVALGTDPGSTFINPNPIRPVNPQVNINRGPNTGYIAGNTQTQIDQTINSLPGFPIPQTNTNYGYQSNSGYSGTNPTGSLPIGQQLSGGTQFVNNNNLLPARPYQFRARDDGTLKPLEKTGKKVQKRAIDIEAMRFVEAPVRSNRDLMEDDGLDHDEDTFDVATDPVYVTDAGEDDDSNPDYTHFPYTAEERAARGTSMCMNTATVTVLFTVMALMATMLLASIGYISLIFRREKRKEQRDESNSGHF